MAKTGGTPKVKAAKVAKKTKVKKSAQKKYPAAEVNKAPSAAAGKVVLSIEACKQ